jgi:hypothetical protein
MKGANLDFEDAESFGDVQQAKRDNILRVGFQNIHNLPEDCRTSKSRQLVDYVVQKDYDCFMMAEIGLNWTKISANDRWFERISGKFRTSRSVFAHNVTELHQSKVLQPGGVALMSTDDITHRITATGKDPTGLGCWRWTRFQGKNGVGQRAVDFADCVRTGFLSRQDATYALHRTIMKTMEYPMVATTMDKLQ